MEMTSLVFSLSISLPVAACQLGHQLSSFTEPASMLHLQLSASVAKSCSHSSNTFNVNPDESMSPATALTRRSSLSQKSCVKVSPRFLRKASEASICARNAFAASPLSLVMERSAKRPARTAHGKSLDRAQMNITSLRNTPSPNSSAKSVSSDADSCSSAFSGEAFSPINVTWQIFSPVPMDSMSFLNLACGSSASRILSRRRPSFKSGVAALKCSKFFTTSSPKFLASVSVN
mmetsp:Transcript_27602/g.69851  ORF Transcript_27602/g.69851 Transcript_27602/m.69851 type:complete len:233 (+) Transcript_27602:398-1096(+)